MYNVESYIGNCLDSIVNQDIPKDDYEIIILNDGSTDDSYAIAESYARKYDNIQLHSQENIGLYATRNRLLDLAQGDYVYNIDSDDYIIHNCFKGLLEIAFENKLEVLGFKSKDTSRLDLIGQKKEYALNDYKIYDGPEFLSKVKSHHITVWWYFVKRDFLISNSFKFKKNNPLEDGPFTLRLFYYTKKMAFLNADIHRYVKVPSSIMNSKNPAHLDSMVTSYLDVIGSYNDILIEIKNENTSNEKVIDKIKHFKNVSIYFLLFRLVKGNVSISAINSVLNKLSGINAYPLPYFINTKLHKVLIFIFNNKLFFYLFLYPVRFLYRNKVLRLL